MEDEPVAPLEAAHALAASGAGDDAVRLQLAREASGLGMWELDFSTGQVVWDSQCAQLMGTTLEEYDGTVEGYERLVHPDDLEVVRDRVNHAIETLGRMELSYRSLSPGGEVRYLLSRGAVVAENGEPRKLLGAVMDITPVSEATQARTEELRRMRGLVTVAQELGAARDIDAILHTISTHGTSLLNTDGIAVGLRVQGAETIRVFTTSYFDPEVQERYAELPLSFPIPLADTVRTGAAHFFGSRAETAAAFPAAGPILEEADAEAVCSVPLRRGTEVRGAFAVAWPTPRELSPQDRELLTAFAAQTGQALERVEAQEAERAAVAQQLTLGTTLQRSLLTTPPALPGLRVAVRYQPAAAEAQVGGDWYDAFGLPGGTTAVVVGDVTGHDQNAAAAMGQLRNLLRGVSHSRPGSPGETFRVLEDAMDGLQVEALATAVLAHVQPTRSGARLQWANAGHLPPILLSPGGSWEALGEKSADLLLGLQTGVLREEHHRSLPQGALVLFYTDGIAERRGESLDEGITRLGDTLASLCSFEEGCDGDLEVLADQLLGAFSQYTLDDDIAILLLRVEGDHSAQAVGDSRTDHNAMLPEPASVGRGRALVEAMCADHGVALEAADTAVLLTSELLTNAVLHGRSAVGLRIQIMSDRIRVEVRDDNDREPRVDHPESGALSGRGMWLVEALSSSWGVRPEVTGKTVWAEIAR